MNELILLILILLNMVRLVDHLTRNILGSFYLTFLFSSKNVEPKSEIIRNKSPIKIVI